MKIIDNMPIVIITAALLANIAIGVSTGISFTALMVRCIVVTIVFGIFGYMLTETVKNALECSNLNKLNHEKGKEAAAVEANLDEHKSKPTLDIKVPPLDNEEFMNMDDDSNDEFVEVNPVHMGDYSSNGQD